jgi:WD40-like Beta Propeller Repeat
MPDVREVFEMATQKVRPDPGAMERQHRNQRRSAVRRKVGGYGLAAAIVIAGIVIGIVALSNRHEGSIPGQDNTQTPATNTTGVTVKGAPRLVVVSLDGTVRQDLGVVTNMPVDGGGMTLSRDGTTIAYSAGTGIDTIGIDGTGSRTLSLPADTTTYGGGAWSPDGTRIAFSGTRNGNTDIYVMDADGANLRRLTRSPGIDDGPTWSPDGTRIVYADSGTQPLENSYSTTQELYAVPSGGGAPLRLTHNRVDDSQAAYSPDGTQIAFHREGRGWIMDSDGKHQRELPLPGSATGLTPSWSPEGTKIAFTRFDPSWRYGADDSPVVAVYVLDLGSGTVSRVPGAEVVTASTAPQWLPGGNALLINRVQKP